MGCGQVESMWADRAKCTSFIKSHFADKLDPARCSTSFNQAQCACSHAQEVVQQVDQNGINAAVCYEMEDEVKDTLTAEYCPTAATEAPEAGTSSKSDKED